MCVSTRQVIWSLFACLAGAWTGAWPTRSVAQEQLKSFAPAKKVKAIIPPPVDLTAEAAPVDQQATLRRMRRRIQEISEEEHLLGVPAPQAGGGVVPLELAPAIPPVKPTPVPVDEGPTAPPEVAIDWSHSKGFTGAPFAAVTHPNEAEPSVAVRKNGEDIVVTANTYAALSSDRGLTWTFVDPFAKFKPQPQGKEFLCDQVVLYDKARDLMVWYMQHRHKAGEGNLVRLAVASGDKIRSREYSLYDFLPTDIRAEWNNTLLDYPDLASDGTFAYLTLNVFNKDASPAFKGAVTLRIKLDELRDLAELTYDVFTTVPAGDFDVGGEFGLGSLRGARCATAQAVMYFAAHSSPAQETLQIFSWPNNSTAVTRKNVTIGKWRRMGGGSATAPGPDGLGWLSRNDSRITAGWNSGDVIGFAWTAAQEWTNPQAEASARFKNPHVRVELLKKSDLSLLAEPHLYANDTAFAYPAMAATELGELGVTVAYGGKALNASQTTPFPGFAVGMLRTDPDVGKYAWKLQSAARGTTGPVFALDWGDYLWTCEDASEPGTLFGTGFRARADDAAGQITEVFAVRYRRPNGVAASLLPGNVLPDEPAAPADPQVALERRVRQLERRLRDVERLLNQQSRPDRP